ncbi:MAG TPA: mandelate racemase/muconate lactonizing enzyme family protein [Gaiellaceae bacterium]|nr:mandelate racemase/muconate lactonizing enzyme family protein [Gaiellaceae bacterium]
MRIERITTAVVEANYDWTIVRVESENGVCGWGEGFCAPGLTQTIRELASLLEGEDARQVEPLVHKLHLATAHASSGGTVYHAISGIEAALWDLAARALGVPLWQLFGGSFRDRVRIYADCHAGEALTSYGATLVSRRLSWMEGDADDLDEAAAEVHWAPSAVADVYTAERYAERAEEMAERGFTALKFDLDLPLLPLEDLYARTISPGQLERQVAIAEATVQAVAGRAEVAFDLHWRYAPADALRLARALEHLPLLWLEDPTPPQDLESIARISERTTTPICTGENLYRLDGFAALIDRGGVDILAPDIQKVGGLADARRIAAYGDVHSRPLAPHCIAGPIGTLASAHVCASIPNFLALEWHAASVPFFDELVTLGRPLIADGYVALPDAPGDRHGPRRRCVPPPTHGRASRFSTRACSESSSRRTCRRRGATRDLPLEIAAAA